MKEKLIELLTDCGSVYPKADASYLIANGVTVRAKGEWKIRLDDYDCEYAICSACGSEFYDGDNDTVDQRPNFCMECGADMRGEEHETD